MSETSKKIVRFVLHIWGLIWVVALSLIFLELKLATVVILCLLPINHWFAEKIYKYIFLLPSPESKEEKD